MDKKDIYQEITNRIIKDLETGTPVWEKPWENGFTGFLKNEFSNLLLRHQYNHPLDKTGRHRGG